MSWAKKNEGARLYKLKGPTYILVLASDGCFRNGVHAKQYEGTFMGSSLPCYGLHYADQWTVEHVAWSSGARRKADVNILFRGHIQATLRCDALLCLREGTVQAQAATDAQVLRAYLGDQHIYSSTLGEERPWEDGVDLIRFKGSSPATWGGNAKRVSWDELPRSYQDKFLPVVRDPAQYRGMWRMEQMKRNINVQWDRQRKLEL